MAKLDNFSWNMQLFIFQVILRWCSDPLSPLNPHKQIILLFPTFVCTWNYLQTHSSYAQLAVRGGEKVSLILFNFVSHYTGEMRWEGEHMILIVRIMWFSVISHCHCCVLVVLSFCRARGEKGEKWNTSEDDTRDFNLDFQLFLCVHVLFSSLRLAYAHCANICSTISLSFIPFTGPKDSSVSLFFFGRWSEQS